MDEAEKKAAAELEAAKAAEAASAEAKKNEGAIDYEAELAKAKQVEIELKKAKYTIEELKKSKKAETSEDQSSLIDQKLEEFRQQQAAELEAAKAQLAGNALEDELALIADPKARELVRHHYEHSILKTGVSRAQVREDIRKAYVLAHRPIVERMASEESAARASQAATSFGYAGGQSADRDDTDASDEREIAKVMSITGAPYEAAKKLYLRNKSA